MNTIKLGVGAILLMVLLIGSGCSSSGSENEIRREDGVVYNPTKGLIQDEGTPPVEFELVDTYYLSSIEEMVISSIGYLTIDDDGNFYFIDRRQSKLISLNPDGSFRWAVGQEGKGPGDLENPFGMIIHERKIYVANIQGSRIDQFDLEGNFIRSTDVPSEVRFASLIGINNEGSVLMSGANFGTIGSDIYTLNLSSDTLSLLSNITISEIEGDEFSRATSRGSVKMIIDHFVYSFSTSYTLQFYTFSGELQTEVRREFDGTLGPGIYASGNNVSLYSLGRISSPVFLDNGTYLVNVRYPINIDDPNEYAKRASTGETESPVYEEFFDVYNDEHELLYTFSDSDFVEGVGSLTVRDSEGYYYSSFGNDLLIKKYRVTGTTD